MTDKYIHIKTKSSSVIINTTPVAELVYWGGVIDENSDLFSLFDKPRGHVRLQQDIPVSFLPENGRGFFSSPGIEGHRLGYDWSPVFKTHKIEAKNNRIVIISIDETAQLLVKTEVELNEYDILSIRNTLKNLSAESYYLNRLSVTIPLPEKSHDLMSFGGCWLQEFKSHRINISHGTYKQENYRGRTSHEYFPGLITGTNGFSENQGEVWGVHLAWSGNHRMQYSVRSDSSRFIQAEALYFPGEIILSENEEVSTPWVYAGYGGCGLNSMSHHFHDFIRERVITFDKPRPVHLNTWEGIYFSHNVDYIKTMADEAARMGVERFIIDDGWFGLRDDDTSSLGDWFVDKRKYPDGLAPVIEYVKNAGMEFGIWVEPEMINVNSELYKKHPDWLLKLNGYDQPSGRNQFVLNLTNREAYKYIIGRLRWLLKNHDIDYLKWDMNREVVQPGCNGKAAMQNQVKAIYKIIDCLKSEFPGLEIESCSSGGGRIDMEMLKRVDRFWTSDCNDALERQHIQKGMSYFFPLLISGSHIGNKSSHTTNRKHDVNYRGMTALFGHMGVELDPAKESEEEKKGFINYISLHKKYRDLIHYGDLYRLDFKSDVISGLGVINKNKRNGIFFISQNKMSDYVLNERVIFSGLNIKAKYEIKVIKFMDPSLINGLYMEKKPAWMDTKTIYSGDTLTKIGLPLPVFFPESGMLIEIVLAS